MFQKPSKELPRIWNNMCTNYSAQFELMAYRTVPGAKGPAPQLAYSNLAPSHTALRANKLFIYPVNSDCPGEFKHGDSFCEVRLFRNMGKENQQKLNTLDWHPPFYSWLSKTPCILQGKPHSNYFTILFHIIIYLSLKILCAVIALVDHITLYSPFFFSLSSKKTEYYSTWRGPICHSFSCPEEEDRVPLLCLASWQKEIDAYFGIITPLFINLVQKALLTLPAHRHAIVGNTY